MSFFINDYISHVIIRVLFEKWYHILKKSEKHFICGTLDRYYIRDDGWFRVNEISCLSYCFIIDVIYLQTRALKNMML